MIVTEQYNDLVMAKDALKAQLIKVDTEMREARKLASIKEAGTIYFSHLVDKAEAAIKDYCKEQQTMSAEEIEAASKRYKERKVDNLAGKFATLYFGG